MRNAVSDQAVEPVILGYQLLAQFVSRPAASVRSDAYRKPSTLPPRVIIPGRPGLWWRLQDVRDWVAGLEHATMPAATAKVPATTTSRRRGRPTKAEQIARIAAGIQEGGAQ